jgi:hypothetical protein
LDLPETITWIGGIAVGVAAILSFVYQYFKPESPKLDKAEIDIVKMQKDIEALKSDIISIRDAATTFSSNYTINHIQIDNKIEAVTNLIIRAFSHKLEGD